MKRSRAGRGTATRRLTWFAIPMLALAAFAGPSSVAAHGNYTNPSPSATASTEPTQSTEPSQSTEPTATPSQSTEPTATPSQSTEPTATPSQSTEPTATPSQSTEPTATPSQSTEPTCEPPQQPENKEETPVDPCDEGRFTALVTTPVCDGDVPWLDYQVAVENTPNTTVTITFLHPTDPSKNVVYADLPFTGSILWPGAEVDGLGNPVDWPGWTWNGSEWVEGDEWDWVRPSVLVQFEVNPTAVIEVGYPPATPNCSANPPGDVLSETSGPNNPTLPPTDTLGSTQTTTGSSWGLVLLLMGTLSAGILLLTPARVIRRGDRD